MGTHTIAALILLPFAVAFIYAAIHEYRRYKTEGRASYGLVYDEETGTTHVTGIADHEESYDPDDFDPGAANTRDTDDETEGNETEDDADRKT